jgi:hypothetical protein
MDIYRDLFSNNADIIKEFEALKMRRYGVAKDAVDELFPS